MTLGFNSQVLGTTPTIVNVKVQFDCRRFYDEEPVVISSNPNLILPYEYDLLNHRFRCYSFVHAPGVKSVNLTGLMLNPPVQSGTPIATSSGIRNLWFGFDQLVIPGEVTNILIIGAEKLTVGGHRLPDFIFAHLAVPFYDNVKGV